MSSGRESPESKTTRFSSPVWSHFTRLGNGLARCHECPVTLSHKTTITNLKKHFQKKHPHIEIGSVDPLRAPAVSPGDIDPIETAERDEEIDGEETITSDPNTEIVLNKEDIQNAIRGDPDKSVTKGKRKSYIWRHFKKIDYGKAMCRYCHETYNCSTITNLKRHVIRKHPDADATEPFELSEDTQVNTVKKTEADWSEDDSDENLDITNLRDDMNVENEENYEVVEYLEDSSIAKYLSSIASKPSKRIKLDTQNLQSQSPDRLIEVVKYMIDSRRDEINAFGDYVANELRGIETLSGQLLLKKKIQDVIYDTKIEICRQKEAISNTEEQHVQNIITVTSENSYTEIPIIETS